MEKDGFYSYTVLREKKGRAFLYFIDVYYRVSKSKRTPTEVFSKDGGKHGHQHHGDVTKTMSSINAVSAPTQMFFP